MSDRSDFKVASLFGAPYVKGPGALVQKADGTFKDATVEAAYQGWLIGRKGAEGQLKRFDPARSIAIGHMTQINDELRKLAATRPLYPEHVRVILQVMGGSPA